MLRAASEGMAALMRSAPVLERTLAGCFRRAAPLPGMRTISRHVFGAFEQRLAEGDDTIRTVPLTDGARMRVPLRDYCGTLYFDPGAFEPETARFVRATLRRGDVFVDVGASYGFYTLLAGAVLRARGGGQVVAFEPNPAVRRLLEESVRLSGLEESVVVHPCAVGREDVERVPLFLGDGSNTGLSTLRPWTEHLRSGALSSERLVEVPCRSLNSLLREGGICRADVLKIDVESAELDVLEGATEFLKRLRPRYIVCETALGSEAAAFLGERGYAARLLERLSPVSPDWGNVLFVAEAPPRVLGE